MLQGIHRVKLLQHVEDIGDTWLHVQPHSSSVAKQLLGCQVASASRNSRVQPRRKHENCNGSYEPEYLAYPVLQPWM